MSGRKRTHSNVPDARDSKRRKSHQRPPLRQFDFRAFDEKVRKKIYEFCLISKNTISIQVDEPSGFDGEPYSNAQICCNDELVCLKSNAPVDRYGVEELAVGLLGVNKTIHDEAAAVLYGRNIFRFRGRCDAWTDFFYFHWRLTDASRKEVRHLELPFPDINRNKSRSTFSQASSVGVKKLAQFPRLKDITFHLEEDLMMMDVVLLRKIRDSCGRSCLVSLDMGIAALYYEDEGHDHRPVRVSSKALAKIHQWNWVTKGKNFEVVDQSHKLAHEGAWLRWLAKNRRNGMRSGFLSDDTFGGLGFGGELGPSIFELTGWGD